MFSLERAISTFSKSTIGFTSGGGTSESASSISDLVVEAGRLRGLLHTATITPGIFRFEVKGSFHGVDASMFSIQWSIDSLGN